MTTTEQVRSAADGLIERLNADLTAEQERLAEQRGRVERQKTSLGDDLCTAYDDYEYSGLIAIAEEFGLRMPKVPFYVTCTYDVMVAARLGERLVEGERVISTGGYNSWLTHRFDVQRGVGEFDIGTECVCPESPPPLEMASFRSHVLGSATVVDEARHRYKHVAMRCTGDDCKNASGYPEEPTSGWLTLSSEPNTGRSLSELLA